MNISLVKIRIFIIIVFILIFLATVFGLYTHIGISLFVTDLFNREMTLLKMFWEWKALIVLITYSLFAIIGMIKKRKVGLIFSFGISIGFLTFFLIFLGNIIPNDNFDLINIVWLAVSILLQIFIIIALTKIKELFSELRPLDYALIVLLNLSICISFIEMFI